MEYDRIVPKAGWKTHFKGQGYGVMVQIRKL